jgi:chemotaxis protein CheD
MATDTDRSPVDDAHSMKVYTTDPPTPDRIKVGVAEYAAADGAATLVTSGLGSCVGIALVDTDAEVTGLAHAMLPEADGRAAEADGRARTGGTDGAEPAATDGGDSLPRGKYVDTAVPALLDAMVEEGADPERIEARLAGGSAMFDFSSGDGGVGERNVAAAKAVLDEYGIPVIATDVGGDYGRSLTLESPSGSLSVRRAHGDTKEI